MDEEKFGRKFPVIGRHSTLFDKWFDNCNALWMHGHAWMLTYLIVYSWTEREEPYHLPRSDHDPGAPSQVGRSLGWMETLCSCCAMYKWDMYSPIDSRDLDTIYLWGQTAGLRLCAVLCGTEVTSGARWQVRQRVVLHGRGCEANCVCKGTFSEHAFICHWCRIESCFIKVLLNIFIQRRIYKVHFPTNRSREPPKSGEKVKTIVQQEEERKLQHGWIEEVGCTCIKTTKMYFISLYPFEPFLVIDRSILFAFIVFSVLTWRSWNWILNWSCSKESSRR